MNGWCKLGGASSRLHIRRHASGNVELALTSSVDYPAEDLGNVVLLEEIDVNHWVSDVLNMTAHGERPNDYHAFIAHHMGDADLLASEKTLQTVRRVIGEA